MPVKRKITNFNGIFFITFTCHQWLPLIAQANSYDIAYKWFDYLKSKGHYIAGYVIMPNHIHALIAFRNTEQSINTIVGNGKRFMAYEIVERLSKLEEVDLLHHLNLSVKNKDRERNKKHSIWQPSFDWKECRTHKFIKQKLDYIHDNPIRGKWNLAFDVTQYPHSSAKFYLREQQGVYPVISYLELDDVDLTKPL